MEQSAYDVAVAPLEWELVVECAPFPPQFDAEWGFLYEEGPNAVQAIGVDEATDQRLGVFPSAGRSGYLKMADGSVLKVGRQTTVEYPSGLSALGVVQARQQRPDAPRDNPPPQDDGSNEGFTAAVAAFFKNNYPLKAFMGGRSP